MAGKSADRPAGRRPRIGIKEIAELANLSKTAVSYALNGTGRLDADTRARVIAIAREHGYQANLHARSLRGKGFGALAVFASVPPTMTEIISTTDYFIRLWQGAVSAALERGYMLLLAPFGTGPELLGNMPIDGGIIIDPIRQDPILEHLTAKGLPTVLVGKSQDERDSLNFTVDSPHGALATDIFSHFRSRGAERIGVILASQQYSYSVEVRRAYLDWIALTGQDDLFVEIDEAPLESAGYAAAQRLLSCHLRPDAIYTSLDRLAVGAFFAAERAQIRVPDELLIAAGSDGAVTRTAPVAITALDLHPDLLGRSAVEMLINQIEQEADPHEVLVPGDIVFRGSTDRPAAVA
ncbi:LacI family DNA-binding transcriptional regulator [Sinorhizobium sp. BG8]|uniref:LacI family DNA-binding transcriptional regulator n=1 Tax=Sinorhizobium sp. BG8 TaxID=2613773 RepID=UPI00193E3590|nr:LacI family DNA-binding transcriptional regulator [Sinorhizobium sp. BG8]